MRTIFLLFIISFLCTSLYSNDYIHRLRSCDSFCELEIIVPTISIEAATDPVFGREAVAVSGIGLPTTAVAYRPQLPYIPLSFIVPDGKEVTSIQVDTKGRQELTTIYPTYYKPHKGSEKSSLSEQYYFESDTLTLEAVTTQRSAGVQLAFYNLYPIQYSGEKRSLIQYDTLWVRVQFHPARTENRAVVHHLTSLDSSLYCNPEQLKTYEHRRGRASCDLLIFSTDEFLDYSGKWSLGALQELRERQGLQVERVSLAKVLSSASGIDTPQKIRTYLRKAYEEKGFSYLLIVGDHGQIPARILTPNSNPLWGAKAEKIPSDLYYQCLDGNYNSNSDEHWGDRYDSNVDIMPEFAIGRALVENITELENFVYKIITHESQSSCENVLIAAEPLGLKGISSTEHMDEIVLGSSSNNYTTKGFNSLATTTVTTKYGEQQEWTKNDMIQWINSDTYSLINHLGHGYYNWVMLLKNGDESKLINKQLPFLYTQACLSGKFNTDCIAERILTSNRSGFWGGVLNSATGKINGEKKGPSQYLDRFFWDAWFSKGKKRVGDMNRYSHEMCVPMKKATDMTHCIYSSNLLGDPTAPIIGSGMTNVTPNKFISNRNLQIIQKGNCLRFSGFNSLTNAKVALYSLQGKLLQHYALRESSIELPDLASGIYMVQIEAGTIHLSKTITLQ